MKKCLMRDREGEAGTVLVLALVILAILSVIISGLGRDVVVDLGITRNSRLQNEAFNWSESGLDIAEEVLVYAVDTRGDDNGTSFSFTFGNSTYSVSNTGQSLYGADSTTSLPLTGQGRTLANVTAKHIGSRRGDGGSIIIAAGYEGAGKGAGSGTAVTLLYHLTSESNSSVGGGRQRVSEVYGVNAAGY